MSIASVQGPLSVPMKSRPVGSAQSALRLTRRGRIVVGVVVASVLALGVVHWGSSVAATDSHSVVAASSVQVAPGDTLWGIAARVNPGGDIRATIDDIVALNSLESGSKLAVGMTLAVPVPRDE